MSAAWLWLLKDLPVSQLLSVSKGTTLHNCVFRFDALLENTFSKRQPRHLQFKGVVPFDVGIASLFASFVVALRVFFCVFGAVGSVGATGVSAVVGAVVVALASCR